MLMMAMMAVLETKKSPATSRKGGEEDGSEGRELQRWENEERGPRRMEEEGVEEERRGRGRRRGAK